MPFYEIIYETGNKSVANYEDDEEATRALTEHHRRAVNGEPATPHSTTRSDIPQAGPITTWVAERVKKVLVYNEHPGDYLGDQVVSADDVRATFEQTLKDKSMQGMVHLPTVLADVRDMTNALIPEAEQHKHESQYRMDADRELDLAFLKDVE